jgi:hypothetical protein
MCPLLSGLTSSVDSAGTCQVKASTICVYIAAATSGLPGFCLASAWPIFSVFSSSQALSVLMSLAAGRLERRAGGGAEGDHVVDGDPLLVADGPAQRCGVRVQVTLPPAWMLAPSTK